MLNVSDRIDWRFQVALVLAHETGHRIGAISELRWRDIDLPASRVRWSANADKIRNDHVTPLTKPAIGVLREAKVRGLGSEWVLPSPSDAKQRCSRHLLRDWWNRAESLAGLSKIDGLGWHGLRRKFATELKHRPLKDLMALGGWQSHQTIVQCYQKSDEEDMRAALEDRRRRG